MKQGYLWIFLMILTPSLQAKILRVNNNTGLLNVYTSLNDAVGAASKTAVDTIHIEGSVSPYTGNVTIDRKVVIIGPGYFLTSTEKTQYNKEPAKMNGNIIFDTGSQGSVIAGIEQYNMGSTSGFSIVSTSAYAGNKIVIQTDTIKIINCRLFFVELNNNNKSLINISIQKCFFNPGVVYVAKNTANPITSLSISNCFFRNDQTPYDVIANTSVTACADWRLGNNTFYKNFKVTVYNTNIESNAFYSTVTPALNYYSTNTYNSNVSNIAFDAQITTYGGVNDVQFATLENWFSCSGNDEKIDVYYRSAHMGATCPLRDNSDLTSDEKQRGMYGGRTPYIRSGMYAIPSVYSILMDGEVGNQFDMVIQASVH